MRLTCPNCDARYEVPDDAIPETGREVQCSNCGHQWLQMRNAAATPEPEAGADAGSLPGNHAPDPAIADAIDSDGAAASHSDTPPRPAAASLDESVRAILREEAEHEAALRRAEADAARSGAPDDRAAVRSAGGAASAAGGGADAPAPGAARADVAPSLNPGREPAHVPEPMRTGLPSDPAPVTHDADGTVRAPVIAVAPAAVRAPSSHSATPPLSDGLSNVSAPRRDLLPDVEEITSTLRPAGAGPEAEVPRASGPATARRGGFRSGFLVALAVLFVATAIYVSAEDLAQRLPALAPALERYVALIDSLREWLQAMTERATSAMEGAEGG